MLSSLDAGAALTKSGEVLGTPSFMAPEQIDPKLGEIGPATDVYALGATLYFLLTGRAPFAAATVTNLLFAILQKPPPDPRSLAPAVRTSRE